MYYVLKLVIEESMLKEKTTNVIRKTLKIHHMIFHVCNTNSSHFSLVLRSLSKSLTEGLGVSILSFVQLLLGKKRMITGDMYSSLSLLYLL